VELNLIGGDCEINCDGSSSNCSLPVDSYTMRDVSLFHITTALMSRSKIKRHNKLFSNFALNYILGTASVV
jgi:hypothetical protein